MRQFLCLILVFYGLAAKAETYSGPLIDALTQWRPQEVPLSKIEDKIKSSQVDKVAFVFPQKKGSRHEQERNQLSLALKEKIYFGTEKIGKKSQLQSDGAVDDLVGQVKACDCKFVSELMLFHAAKAVAGSKTNANDFVADLKGPLLAKLMDKIHQVKPTLPTQIHYELYNPEEDVPKLQVFLKTYPETQFILTHMGFSDPVHVAVLLDSNPNLFVTISKRLSPYNVTKDLDKSKKIAAAATDKGKLRNEWKDFFEKYQSRILFATDANYPFLWEKYPQLIQEGRDVLGQISAEAAAKIAYKNAQQLYHLQ